MKKTPASIFPSFARPMLTALAIFALAGQTFSAVIYRNNFGNGNTPIDDAGEDIAFNTASVGWEMLRAENGGNAILESGTNVIGAIRNSTGRPDDIGNVNAPVSASDEFGIAYLRNGTTPKYTGLAYTTQYLVDRSIYDVDSFQWYANGTEGVPTQRLALEVGGEWYVATAVTPPRNSFGDFDTGAAQFTIDIDATSWFSLTATEGLPFAIGGTPVALPTGNITGFGLYLDPGLTSNYYSRFDTFTINAEPVPEPGAFALIGLAGLALLGRRRKCRV